MIALLLASLISTFLFLVLGTTFSKAFNLASNLTEKLLIGLVVTNIITTLFSLFIPINEYVLAIFLLSCFFFTFYIRKELVLIISTLKEKIIIVLICLPFILIALIISMGPPLNWDTGLYHLQSIKWIEEYSIIPGLANLHGRFGFNPNIFTVCALTSLSKIFGQEIFSLNFLLFSIFVLHFINKLYTVFKDESISNYFIFNFIVFITILNLADNISSPSPDFLSISFPLFILTGLTKSSHVSRVNDGYNYATVLILSLYIVTVKLATIPILILAVLLFFRHQENKRQIFRLVPFMILILVPWLARNIILSGWLVYPLPVFDVFNFDWKVSRAQVELEKLAITGFARSHGQQTGAASHMTISEWFPLWWNGLVRTDKCIFLASIFSPVFILFNYVFKYKKIDFNTLAVIITSFIGVIFWFTLAPDFRFGKGFIFISALSLLLYYKFKIQVYWEPNFKQIFVFHSLVLILVTYFGKSNTSLNFIRIAQQNRGRMITPKIIEKPENIKFESYMIDSIKIFIPTKEDRCFDHPLPCTGYSDTTLKLRGISIQSGFKNGKPKL